MSKMNFNTKKSGFWEGKGFYIALAFCLIAVGAASYVAIRSIAEAPDSLDLESGYSSSPSSEGALKAGQNVSGAQGSKPAKTESSGSASSKSTSSAAAGKPVATFYVIPIASEVQKGFSDTELQYSETYNDWRIHAAIDIKANEKDPVRAAGDGTVLEVKTDRLLGVTATIDHGNGVTSHYSGLIENPPIKKGDTVKAGHTIGYVGRVPCEIMDGFHLHFAMAQNGKWISPLKTMNLLEEN